MNLLDECMKYVFLLKLEQNIHVVAYFFQIDTVINMELRNRRLDPAPNLDGNTEINGEDDDEPLLNEYEV